MIEDLPCAEYDDLLECVTTVLRLQTDHGAKLILAEVKREHGQASVDGLIRELELERILGFKPGSQRVSGDDPAPT